MVKTMPPKINFWREKNTFPGPKGPSREAPGCVMLGLQNTIFSSKKTLYQAKEENVMEP